MAFIKEINLTGEQRTALKELKKSEYFDVFVEVAENLMQAKAYGALASHPDLRHERIDEAAGGRIFWIALLAIVNNLEKYE
jgi:hypothetical protein